VVDELAAKKVATTTSKTTQGIDREGRASMAAPLAGKKVNQPPFRVS
jgi:hypothetical protein